MRQYWINFRGKQEGPMSIEQLAQKGVDETAYVWHSGLPDWVKITSVPELKDMLAGTTASTEPVATDAESDVQDAAVENVETVEEANIPDEVPSLDVIDYSAPAAAPYVQQPYPVAEPANTVEPAPKCPPTNLVWAIIVTIFCCSIPGILGIVFAFLTKKHYREGNFEKAQRMSDYGAWSIIASIILGLITMPLSCAVQMAQLGNFGM
jgi:hypothetical protein